jgi:sugar lactone lactonase YvrE
VWQTSGGNAAEGTSSGMNNPRGVAVDKDGIIFVVDMIDHQMLKFSKDGDLMSRMGGKMSSKEGSFSFPNGIFIGENGYIYVTDRMNQRIQLFK